MDKQNTYTEDEKGIWSSQDEACFLYNEYGYNNQISEVLSGEIEHRPEMLPLLPPYRLSVINNQSLEYDLNHRSSRKNKWVERKRRGWNYRMSNKDIVQITEPHGRGESQSSEAIKQFLWTHLPPGTIRKETKSNIYLLCPFHKENTPSLCIGKEKGGHVKCFGCGKSMLLSTLLSMTLGHTRKYRHDQLLWRTKWGNSKQVSPNQLEIPFPDTPENGSI